MDADLSGGWLAGLSAIGADLRGGWLAGLNALEARP
jgi:hypothetical protein